MELISDERLATYIENQGELGMMARELQRYRASGPLPIELKPGQRWERADGGSYTIGNSRNGNVDPQTCYIAVHGDRCVYDDDATASLIATLREGGYRLVAGPGAKP